MQAMDILPVYTPSQCTDVVSPVDRHMAQNIKQRIKGFFDDAYEADVDKWDEGLSSGEKRMLVASWASRAWSEFCAEMASQIRESFVKTGYLVAKDGSEMELIQMQGWKSEWGIYDFRPQ